VHPTNPPSFSKKKNDPGFKKPNLAHQNPIKPSEEVPRYAFDPKNTNLLRKPKPTLGGSPRKMEKISARELSPVGKIVSADGIEAEQRKDFGNSITSFMAIDKMNLDMDSLGTPAQSKNLKGAEDRLEYIQI
jgi:hypothetical protein